MTNRQFLLTLLLTFLLSLVHRSRAEHTHRRRRYLKTAIRPDLPAARDLAANSTRSVRVKFDTLAVASWVGKIAYGIRAIGRGSKGSTAYFGPRGSSLHVMNTTQERGNLGSPNAACTPPGPGVGSGGAPGQPGANCKALGNALIIQASNKTAVPTSSPQGGVMVFRFPNATSSNHSNSNHTQKRVAYLDAVAILGAEFPVRIKVLDRSGASFKFSTKKMVGPNALQVVKLGVNGTHLPAKMILFFNSSLAVPFFDIRF